jgi:hypothetical protein
MNLVFLGIIIFIILTIVFTWFAKANTQQVSKNIRIIIVFLSIIAAITLVVVGRLLLAAPLLLLILPLIKLKSGLSLFKALMIFRLLNRLKQQGRFSYTSGASSPSESRNINLNEAYEILNCKKGDTKEKIESNYKKLMFKVHPDLNKDIDSTKISQILTEAKDLIIKTDFT